MINLNPDHYLQTESGRVFTPERSEGAIFVDAALPGARHRARILSAAKTARTAAIAIWINVPLETALARNRQRPTDEQVSEDVIRYVFSNFEPPTIDEGFVEINSVQSP